MKKILNDLKLKYEAALWALDPELALIDTILEQHLELFEIVKGGQATCPVTLKTPNPLSLPNMHK